MRLAYEYDLLGRLGPELAAGAQEYAIFLRQGLVTILSIAAPIVVNAMVSVAEGIATGDYVGAALEIGQSLAFKGLGALGKALNVSNR